MPTEPRIAARELSKPSLTLKRRLKAAPATVYAAWTDPSQLMRWFGPDGGPGPERGGGRPRRRPVSHRLCTEDGEEHNVSGLYREVVPEEKLAFTWMWRTMPKRMSLVTVLLKRDGEGTLLTLTHEQFFDEPARDRHREGWMGALDKLEGLFA